MHVLLRTKLIAPVVVLILTVAAIAAVWLLIERADASRSEQLQTARMALSLSDLQSAPFNAEPSAGGDPAAVLLQIHADERLIAAGLTAHTQGTASRGLLAGGRSQLAGIEPIVMVIYRIAVQKGGLSAVGAQVAELQKLLTVRSQRFSSLLQTIGEQDAGGAAQAGTQAKLGAGATMIVLLLAFSYFYFRAIGARQALERLAHSNERLLGISRIEARTDALTGLGNRRALAADMATPATDLDGPGELLLVMFDLDRFKQYNDSFGHAAGDALLQRLGNRLAASAGRCAGAYRMGGDEFCMLARCTRAESESLLENAVQALQDSGENWSIGCSHGAVWIPSEAATASHALKLSDERMYANKASHSARRATDVLQLSPGRRSYASTR